MDEWIFPIYQTYKNILPHVNLGYTSTLLAIIGILLTLLFYSLSKRNNPVPIKPDEANLSNSETENFRGSKDGGFDIYASFIGNQKTSNAKKILSQSNPRLVSIDWPEQSGFKSEMIDKGYQIFRWSNPEKVESRILNGYSVMYGTNKTSGEQFHLVSRDGQIFIGK